METENVDATAKTNQTKRINKIAKKAPSLGDVIVHHEPTFNRTNTGKVVQLLSQQFVYETENGQSRFCLFKEDWKYVK